MALATSSWLDDERRISLSEEELRLLFRVRWGLLTRTHRVHPFGPDLNAFRRYYAVLLAHPEGPDDVVDRARRRLSYVEALAKVDPSYPASFARGTLLYELGEVTASARAFEAFLNRTPDGPFVTLARNHWLFTRTATQYSEP